MTNNLEAAFSETQIYFKLSHRKVTLPTLVMKHEKRNYRMLAVYINCSKANFENQNIISAIAS